LGQDAAGGEEVEKIHRRDAEDAEKHREKDFLPWLYQSKNFLFSVNLCVLCASAVNLYLFYD
jgi:hypothetical protein